MRIDRIKLKTELFRRDLTQTELSRKAGISRTTLGFVTSGKSCSDATGKKICAALGMDPEELIEEVK